MANHTAPMASGRQTKPEDIFLGLSFFIYSGIVLLEQAIDNRLFHSWHSW